MKAADATSDVSLLLCILSQVKASVDWNRVCAEAGIVTVGAAKMRFARLQKRHQDNLAKSSGNKTEDVLSANTKGSKVTKKPTGKKAVGKKGKKNPESDGDDAEVSGQEE